jgi:hypothetical protein
MRMEILAIVSSAAGHKNTNTVLISVEEQHNFHAAPVQGKNDETAYMLTHQFCSHIAGLAALQP